MSFGERGKKTGRASSYTGHSEVYREKSTNRFARFLYMVGIQSVRIIKRFFRHAGRFFRPVMNLFRRIHYALWGRSIEWAHKERDRIRQGFSIAGARMREARRRGLFYPVIEFFKISGRTLVRHRRVLTTLFNTVTPVAAIVLLLFSIHHFGNLSYGLQVEWNGKDLAYIKSEEVYGSAAEMLSQRIVDESENSRNLTPKYTLAVLEDDTEINSADTVCNKLIEESENSYKEAYGLYVDRELVGAVDSRADMSFVLQSILNGEKGPDETAKAAFTSDVQLTAGLYSTDSIVETSEIQETLTSKIQEEQYATVKKGETGSAIADRYGMTVSELKDLNPDADVDKLIEGQEVKVAKPRSFLTVKIIKEEVYTKELPYSTVTLKDNSRYTTYSSVTQQGSMGEIEYRDSVTFIDGVEISRKNVEKVTLKEPVDQKVVVGTKKAPSGGGGGGGGGAPDSNQAPTGRFIWPAPTVRQISSNFGYRWGRLHAGIDIANGRSRGQPVVASDAGTVNVSSGGGYGLCIRINHGNGWQTLYAHLSAANVRSGQRVSQGQTIGKIGNSGNSQGNHLHFEIRRNGTPLNPRKYVSP